MSPLIIQKHYLYSIPPPNSDTRLLDKTGDGLYLRMGGWLCFYV